MEDNVLKNWPKYNNSEYLEFKKMLYENIKDKPALSPFSALLSGNTHTISDKINLNEIEKHNFYIFMSKSNEFLGIIKRLENINIDEKTTIKFILCIVESIDILKRPNRKNTTNKTSFRKLKNSAEKLAKELWDLDSKHDPLLSEYKGNLIGALADFKIYEPKNVRDDGALPMRTYLTNLIILFNKQNLNPQLELIQNILCFAGFYDVLEKDHENIRKLIAKIQKDHKQ